MTTPWDLSDAALEAMAQQRRQEREWQEHYGQATHIRQQWAVLREMYQALLPEILAASKKRIRSAIFREVLPWKFSQIEEPVWITIRGFGLPFYPQFPVDRYFVDFASPAMKIGIETDGRLWHNQDKDWKRDRRLMALGWRIFRITGSEVYAGLRRDMPEDEESFPEWMSTTYDGILTAIDYLYFRDEPWTWSHYDSAVRALHAHRLMPFPIITARESPPEEDTGQWHNDWSIPEEHE